MESNLITTPYLMSARIESKSGFPLFKNANGVLSLPGQRSVRVSFRYVRVRYSFISSATHLLSSMSRTESGETCAETGKIFGVGGLTVQSWVQRYEETGDLSDKPLKRGPKKLPPEQLRAYVQQHSDATQQEIADAFGCSNQAVSKALKRLNITRKKRRAATGNRMGRK